MAQESCAIILPQFIAVCVIALRKFAQFKKVLESYDRAKFCKLITLLYNVSRKSISIDV